MKKALFTTLILLTTIGMTFAQDVWSAITFGFDGLTDMAFLYKNDEQVLKLSDDTLNYRARDVLVLNGHTYFAYNATGGGYVYDYTDASMYLETGEGAFIRDIFPGANGTEVVTLGYKRELTVDYAIVWEGSTPTLTLGNGTYSAFGLCGCTSEDGNIYVGGYQKTSNTGSNYYGVIWSGSGELYVMPSGTEVRDVAFYDGNLYSLVDKTDEGHDAWVYKNDEILYHLKSESSHSASAYHIFIEGGDIYVCGQEETDSKVWKNGETLYSLEYGGWVNIWVNSKDVYCQGYIYSLQRSMVWKNGEELFFFYSSDGIGGMFVEPLQCENTEPRPLPYYEGFEMGETEWECWTKLDVDNDNCISMGCLASYWDRSGTCSATLLNIIPPHTGDHAAAHRDLIEDGHPQEGWLISPRLSLQPNYNATLTFYSANYSPYYYGYNGVMVSTSDDPTDLSSYTELWHPESVTNTWEEITIDLSAYAGKNVYIAFKYVGENSHEWYVDDIMVEEIQSQFAVTVETNNASWGTVTGGGLFEEGAIATIHAEPKSGYIFLNWTKDGSEVSTNANYSFTVSAATAGTYKAWFGEPTVTYYTVTAVPDDPSQGMVTGGGTYAVGTEITLQAFPYGGYVFDRWNDGNTDNPRKITVNTNQNLTAYFKVNAVDENGATAISVYPNPAKDAIHLEGLETETEILFYNTLGMLVKSVTASDGEISVSDLAPGLYLLRCGPQTLRFIKTN